MGEYYIAHSSGPWKKHKYIKKIGEGANAIYQYAYNAAGGKYKNKARYYKDKEKGEDTVALNRANKAYHDHPEGSTKEHDWITGNSYNISNKERVNRAKRDLAYDRFNAAANQHNYENSLAGKSDQLKKQISDDTKKNKKKIRKKIKSVKRKTKRGFEKAIGADEKMRYESAKKATKKAKKTYDKHKHDVDPKITVYDAYNGREKVIRKSDTYDSPKSEYKRARENERKAKKAYDYTLMGTASRIKKAVKKKKR